MTADTRLLRAEVLSAGTHALSSWETSLPLADVMLCRCQGWHIFPFSPNYLLVRDCAGSLLLHRLSLVAASESYSLATVHGLLLAVAARVAEHGL